jgi:hypothetical protein
MNSLFSLILEKWRRIMGQKIGSIFCKLVAITSEQLEGKSKAIGQQTGAMVIVDIVNNEGAENRLVVSRIMDLNLELGDKIRCIAGRALVIIDEAKQSGSFIISENSSNSFSGKYPNLLEVTAELTKNQPLGKIPTRVISDIGKAIKSAAASTRKLTENATR